MKYNFDKGTTCIFSSLDNRMNYRLNKKYTFFPRRVEGKWARHFWAVETRRYDSDYYSTRAKFFDYSDARLVLLYMFKFGIY